MAGVARDIADQRHANGQRETERVPSTRDINAYGGDYSSRSGDHDQCCRCGYNQHRAGFGAVETSGSKDRVDYAIYRAGYTDY